MRLFAFLSVALLRRHRQVSSPWAAHLAILAFALSAQAALHPRYGGTLRMETARVITTLDPAEWPPEFRVSKFEPGKRIELAANEDHPAGRPFLDAITIDLARPLREQALDLELGRADVIEIAPADLRRVTQAGMRTWASSPIELVAIIFQPNRQAPEALSPAIDRAAIHTVLLQRQGEPTAAIVPQWISGFAFLFSSARNLDRARELATKSAPSFTLAYDPVDRTLAERIVLNAREAGLVVRAVSGDGDARLVHIRIRPNDPFGFLAEPPPAPNPEAAYAAERAILEKRRVVPLFHLPVVYGIAARVRNWSPQRTGELRLADLWLQ